MGCCSRCPCCHHNVLNHVSIAQPCILQYLRSKNRVGVVTLPALQQAALASAAPVPRTLYLVPPSEEVCGQLGMDWQACCTHCLLALVVLTPPQQAPPQQ